MVGGDGLLVNTLVLIAFVRLHLELQSGSDPRNNSYAGARDKKIYARQLAISSLDSTILDG